MYLRNFQLGKIFPKTLIQKKNTPKNLLNSGFFKSGLGENSKKSES